MNYCLYCGTSRRGKKQSYACDCGGCTTKITRQMLPVAVRLHSLGFEISTALDYISAAFAPDSIRLVLVHIDFKRVYNREMFKSMPEGWVYDIYKDGDRPFCRVAMAEHHTAFSVIPDAKLIKYIITEFDMWLRSLETDNRIEIYTLAGWV